MGLVAGFGAGLRAAPRALPPALRAAFAGALLRAVLAAFLLAVFFAAAFFVFTDFLAIICLLNFPNRPTFLSGVSPACRRAMPTRRGTGFVPGESAALLPRYRTRPRGLPRQSAASCRIWVATRSRIHCFSALSRQRCPRSPRHARASGWVGG